MIEFNGRISGAAEKHFWRKSQIFGRNILFTATLIILPFIIHLSNSLEDWRILVFYSVLIVIIPLLAYIPQSKKERNAMVPKRIYTEDNSIVCVADKYTERKYTYDTKELRDHGEFYELVFSFGNLSDKFICQKDLLTSGTLEEFEALFEGKISRLQ